MKRVRRALLFMPGDDLRKIEKGASAEADSIIMDLEDGVAFSRKAEARQTISHALSRLDFGTREKLVRTNPASSELVKADIYETIDAHPHGYMLPKVESAADVQRVSAWLDEAETKNGWPAGSLCLLGIIESALGVVNLREIATASPRLQALCFGAEDLAGSLGAVRSVNGEEVTYAKQAVVLYAKAFNLAALDTPYTAIHDLDGLAKDAGWARNLGYDGKLAIHPKHLPIIIEAFTPSAEEIAHAQALITAFEAHQRNGVGVFTHAGKMIEMPMIRAAQDVLARAGITPQSG